MLLLHIMATGILRSSIPKDTELLAGSGMNAGNAAELMERTGISQVHSSCRGWLPDPTTVNSFAGILHTVKGTVEDCLSMMLLDNARHFPGLVFFYLSVFIETAKGTQLLPWMASRSHHRRAAGFLCICGASSQKGL